MSVLNFRRSAAPEPAQTVSPEMEAFLKGYSIEVMPRTLAKVDDIRALLPEGTRVYIAHIEGTPIARTWSPPPNACMRPATRSCRISRRASSRTSATLADWIARYQGEADIRQALLLAGGVATPHGDFHSSMQLLETGLFDGFERLHVAGHP